MVGGRFLVVEDTVDLFKSRFVSFVFAALAWCGFSPSGTLSGELPRDLTLIDSNSIQRERRHLAFLRPPTADTQVRQTKGPTSHGRESFEHS